MIRKVTLEEVVQALQRPLAGFQAQAQMSTRPRTAPEEFPQGRVPREGAVLVLLYPQDKQLFLPLTRRTERVATHKGQISLPGGAQESGDGSLWHTALREAEEEVGSVAEDVQRLGELSSLYIPPSNFDIHPFVGYLPSRPAFVLDANEVAELIEMPLAVILEPSAKGEENRILRGRPTQVPFYHYRQHVIWGATAMVLSELEAMLSAVLR